jgi:hypothetical protein
MTGGKFPKKDLNMKVKESAQEHRTKLSSRRSFDKTETDGEAC